VNSKRPLLAEHRDRRVPAGASTFVSSRSAGHRPALSQHRDVHSTRRAAPGRRTPRDRPQPWLGCELEAHRWARPRSPAACGLVAVHSLPTTVRYGRAVVACHRRHLAPEPRRVGRPSTPAFLAILVRRCHRTAYRPPSGRRQFGTGRSRLAHRDVALSRPARPYVTRPSGRRRPTRPHRHPDATTGPHHRLTPKTATPCSRATSTSNGDAPVA